MLDDYKVLQPMGYKILKRAILNTSISHAYLIDVKHSSVGENFVFAFAKSLLCPYQYTSYEHCDNCTQCGRIDNHNYTEIKIIDSDGLWIKKEQLDILQEDFSKKAVEGEKRVYIIHDVEKLNKSAANSLLKFLEEPEPNIIAILTTHNFYQVLDTIVSRCQILTLSYDRENNTSQNLSMVELVQAVLRQKKYDISNASDFSLFDMHIQNVLHFLLYYEKNGINALLHMQKLWHSHFCDKDDLLLSFDIMILFYKDLLNYCCNQEVVIFLSVIEQNKEILFHNTLENVIAKINILLKQKQKIYVNINSSLLMDKLILELEEVVND